MTPKLLHPWNRQTDQKVFVVLHFFPTLTLSDFINTVRGLPLSEYLKSTTSLCVPFDSSSDTSTFQISLTRAPMASLTVDGNPYVNGSSSDKL